MSTEEKKPKEEPGAEKAAGAKPEGEGGEPGEGGKRKGPAKPAWYRRPGIVGLLVLVLAVLVVTVALVWRHTRTYVTTDDAYIDGIPQIVSPQVEGRVVKVLVDDNQDVKAGQELVTLDPSDYQARVAQAEASMAQARAQLAQAGAQGKVYSAQADEAQASLGTAEANRQNAANQLGRYTRLSAVDAAAVSAQQMDAARAAATSTAAAALAAQKAVAAAKAQLAYSASLEEAARAGIASAQAQVDEARLTLSYTHVIARIDGRVANKTVTEGSVVAAGAPVMAVVPRDVYVTANLKETQLNHLRPGQPVTVHVDAYPAMKLSAKVASVEPASGQTFSAIPPQNATGNWVKIVQRVAVKIVFDKLPDDPGERLAPGMSVEISAKVR
ncbi:MAG TPA: HlyD family secretion protein [Opitutaceae bacterium]|jgi:membrane fusion protein (multidrug efflux system)